MPSTFLSRRVAAGLLLAVLCGAPCHSRADAPGSPARLAACVERELAAVGPAAEPAPASSETWARCAQETGSPLPSMLLDVASRWKIVMVFSCRPEDGAFRCKGRVENHDPAHALTMLTLGVVDAATGNGEARVAPVRIPSGKAQEVELLVRGLPPLHQIRLLEAWGRRSSVD